MKAIVWAFRMLTSDLDASLLERLPASLRARLVGPAEGPVRLDVAAALGRTLDDADRALLIEVHLHLTRLDAGPDGDVIERWEMGPPHVEAVVEAAEDLALHGPIGPGDLALAAAPFRELLVNAIVHRSYDDDASGRSIEIRRYPDAVVIVSPGGLPPGVAIKAGRPGPCVVRNPELMAVFVHVGLARHQGLGVGLAARALSDRGYRLAYEADVDEVRAIVRLDTERTLTRMSSGARPHLPRPLLYDRILGLLRLAPHRASEIASALVQKNPTVRAALRALIAQGLVEPTCGAARSPSQMYRLVPAKPTEPSET